MIPIAYAIKRGCDVKTSKADLRLLLIKSLLTGVYGSSGDQVLPASARVCRRPSRMAALFELAMFEKKVRLPGGKNIAINQEALDSLLLSTKGSRSFALLSLLTPHLKFSQVRFPSGPYSSFRKNSTRRHFALKLSDDGLKIGGKRDVFPICICSKGRKTRTRTREPFWIWVQRNMQRIRNGKIYLRSHHIPKVPLELEKFRRVFLRNGDFF